MIGWENFFIAEVGASAELAAEEFGAETTNEQPFLAGTSGALH
jgi:hypothetical protein